METFFAAYPWIILSLGVFDAAAVTVIGAGAAGAFVFLSDEARWGLWDRLWPSALIMLLTTAATAGVLAATRGMLVGV
jgi:hypothetical protein